MQQLPHPHPHPPFFLSFLFYFSSLLLFFCFFFGVCLVLFLFCFFTQRRHFLNFIYKNRLTGLTAPARGVLPAAALHVRPVVPALPAPACVRPAQTGGPLARARVAEAGIVDGGADVEDVAAVDPQAVHAAHEVVAADVAGETQDGVEVLHAAPRSASRPGWPSSCGKSRCQISSDTHERLQRTLFNRTKHTTQIVSVVL